MTVDLSIVIVTTDGLDFTHGCIQSIIESTRDLRFEIVLVDNASEPAVDGVIREQFPFIRCIRNTERRGFAENYNAGLAVATGEFFMILNDDTIVRTGALDRLVEFLRRNPEYAFITGKLVSTDGSIQPGCARRLPTIFSYCMTMLLLDPGIPTGRMYYRYLSRKLAERRTGTVEAILGACMVTTRAHLKEIGLMDEGYGFYFVEDDWCYRAAEIGYKTGYVAEAEILHFGDQTMANLREWGQRQQYFGALRYFHRCRSTGTTGLWFLWLVLLTSYFLRGVVFSAIGAFGDRRGYGAVYFRLAKWLIRSTPSSAQVASQISSKPAWPPLHGRETAQS